MKLEVVTRTAKVVDAEVESVFLPGYHGEMGILPSHAPLLTRLGIGELRYRTDGTLHSLAVSHGFAEILGQRLIILADARCFHSFDTFAIIVHNKSFIVAHVRQNNFLARFNG